MKITRPMRIISMVLIAVMTIPAIASADRITGIATAYDSIGGSPVGGYSTSLDSNVQYTNQNGWYRVPYNPMGGTSELKGQYVYVKESDSGLTVLERSATVEPTETITAAPTLAPGATPTPKPVVVEGSTDTSYTASTRSYTVTTAGLAIYKSEADARASLTGSVDPAETLKSGQTVTLTPLRGAQIFETDGTTPVLDKSGNPTYNYDYSVYTLLRNNTTYYVPSALLTVDNSSTDQTVLDKTYATVKSLTINAAAPVPYYTAYKYDSTPSVRDYVMDGTHVGDLAIGTTLNVTYVRSNIFSFIGATGATYYFKLGANTDAKDLSTATVGSGSTANLATTLNITAPANTVVTFKLFLSPSNSASTATTTVTVTGGASDATTLTLLGTKVGEDEWYEVLYSGKYYYFHKTHSAISTGGTWDSEQVAVNNTVSTATFYITIRAVDNTVDRNNVLTNPLQYYREHSNSTKTLNPVGGALTPGGSYLVSQVNSVWYAYTYLGTVYYIHHSDIATGSNTSSANMTSYLVTLTNTVNLYDKMLDSASPRSDSATILSLTGGKTSDTFTVKSVDATWFSITIGGGTYYIKKSDVGLISSATPVGTTVEGKTYRVVMNAATTTYLSSDLSPASASGYPLQAGQIVSVTKVSNMIYSFVVTTSDGKALTCYFSATNVASVIGGDDATTLDGTDSSQNIADIIKGEQASGMTNEVIYFTVPTGGVWLYVAGGLTPALSVDAGKTLVLTSQAPTHPTWYTTWYNGKEYWISVNSLKSSESLNEMKQNTSYSLQISSATGVPLYRTFATKTTLPYDFKNAIDSTAFLGVGGGTYRIDVKVHAQFYDRSLPTPAYVPAVYSTSINGTTYYINPTDLGLAYVSGSLMNASVGSIGSSNVMTKFTITTATQLYLKPDLNYTSVTVKALATDPDVELFGISYDDDFYQVIVDGAVRYLQKSLNGTNYTTSQTTVSNEATSSTHTVVIGTVPVPLYNSTSLKYGTGTTAPDNYYPTPGGPATYLQPGQVVLANQVNSVWYSMDISQVSGTPSADRGITVYFQIKTGTNGTVSNSNVASSLSSYNVTPTQLIDLYTDISENRLKIDQQLQIGQKYTVRRVNSNWLSVYLNGSTYYIMDTQISGDLFNAVAIASSSVGKTYTITIGQGGTPLRPDDDLVGASLGTVPGGTTTTGVKTESKNGTISYYITYNNIPGYVDATDVAGIKAGDEVDEARQAAEEAANSNTVYASLPSGTEVYASMDASGTPSILPSTSTYKLTKINDSWYSLEFMGQTYYIPASEVASSAGIGSTTAVGSSIMHTLASSIPAYAAPSLDATRVGTVMAGQLMKMTKVSEGWFEIVQGTSIVYVRVADVDGNSGTSTSTLTTTDANGGIITPTIKITATSGTVNLRKSASLGSTALARIPINTVLTNNGYEKDANGQFWYKVTYQGVSGYVIGTYVTAIGTVSSGGTTSTGDPSQDVGRTLTVNVSSVNIRSGAGTTFGIIGKLEKNAQIIPTAYKEGTDGMIWYSFQLTTSAVGWVRYDYLSGTSIATSEMTGNVAIKAGDTNLRSGAGATFTVVAKLPRDTIVTITGTGTDKDSTLWYRVTVNNLSGYVRSDLVRTLTTSESNNLANSVVSSYTELKYGSTGSAVLALQQQLIAIGYLAAGSADGTYGTKTTAAVTAFQTAKGLTANGVASPATQAAIFNTSVVSSGSTQSLDWYSTGVTLIKQYPNVQIHDLATGVIWNAKYINGANHADVVPASSGDAAKLTANSITGSYLRRPVIVTINGQKYAGSMYAVGHGSTNYVSYFSGVLCLHFTGSRTHDSNNVDTAHQDAISAALNSGF